MFTGIVEELGEVVALEWDEGGRGAVLRVRGGLVASDAVHGASISVSGVCLTVTGVAGDEVSFDVMKESFDRSALGSLHPRDRVNLERAVTVATRLGGHIVQGHVDGVGTVAEIVPGDTWTDVRVTLPPGLHRYLVEKGSICVDGVSLTVVSVDPRSFTVSLIPTTLELTTLGLREPGDLVNLEVDVVAKYVEKLVTMPGSVGVPGGTHQLAGDNQ
jgi:riboflavin synthase